MSLETILEGPITSLGSFLKLLLKTFQQQGQIRDWTSFDCFVPPLPRHRFLGKLSPRANYIIGYWYQNVRPRVSIMPFPFKHLTNEKNGPVGLFNYPSHRCIPLRKPRMFQPRI